MRATQCAQKQVAFPFGNHIAVVKSTAGWRNAGVPIINWLFYAGFLLDALAHFIAAVFDAISN